MLHESLVIDHAAPIEVCLVNHLLDPIRNLLPHAFEALAEQIGPAAALAAAIMLPDHSARLLYRSRQGQLCRAPDCRYLQCLIEVLFFFVVGRLVNFHAVCLHGWNGAVLLEKLGQPRLQAVRPKAALRHPWAHSPHSSMP